MNYLVFKVYRDFLLIKRDINFKNFDNYVEKS